MNKQRIVLGISGASGIVYGVRLLEMLRATDIESHLVVTRAADMTRAHETDLSAEQLRELADHTHAIQDVGAAIASGSFQSLGMIVAPCSLKSLAEIATGVSGTLLTRAADVVLKERRKLVLMVRDAPYNLIHLRNMTTVTEAGGIIFPPVPAFYQDLRTLDDMINDTAARILSLFGVESRELKEWAGLQRRPETRNVEG